jgi:hypothetical protein
MSGEMKELKMDHKELMAHIYENGFLKKEDLDEAWKRGDEVHKRQDAAIDRLEDDLARLEARLDAR